MYTFLASMVFSIFASVSLAAEPLALASAKTSYGKLPLSFEPNRGQTDPAVKFICRGNGYGLFLNSGEAVLMLAHAAEEVESNSALAPVFNVTSILKRLIGNGEFKTKNAGLGHSFSKDPLRGLGTISVDLIHMTLIDFNLQSTAIGIEPLPGISNYFKGNDSKKWITDVPQYARVVYKGAYPGIDLVYYGNQSQLEYDFKVSPGADPRTIRWKIEGEGAHEIRLDNSGNLILSTLNGDVAFKAPTCYQTSGIEKKHIPSRYVLRERNKVAFEIAPYDGSKELTIDPVLVYSTYLAGNYSVSGNGIAIDTSGNAYVTGMTLSAIFPTVNAFQATLKSSYDAFVTKFNPSGNGLIYSTYLGGSNDDAGHGIDLDAAGNAYITGQTSSADFPVMNAYQGSYSGSIGNAFVTKLNSSGNALIYSTYLGGNLSDAGSGIAIDLSGNAYVTGGTDSTNFPVVNAFQPTMVAGQFHGFVSKFNAAGNGLIYSTYLGGSGADGSNGIAVDQSGNAYVVGYTQSSDFPVANAFQVSLAATINAFVTKLNVAGNGLIYSTYLGGTGGEYGQAIALDASGNAYVTGITFSANFPLAGPIQAICGGCVYPQGDVFVSKINPTGNGLIYSTYLGGTRYEFGTAIAVDSSNNAYVAGYTNSLDFPMINACQTNYGGPSDDAFVAKINSSGTAIDYSTYLGGNGGDQPRGIAVDGSGNVFITGVTYSSDFPMVGPYQGIFSGGAAAFVLKLSDLNSTPTASGTASPVFSPSVTPTLSATWSFSPTVTPTLTPGPFPAPELCHTYLQQWGSSGTALGQFSSPQGIASDGNYLYVADSNNNRIQMFDLNGNTAGAWGSSGFGPGQFNNPVAVAVGGSFVFVADTRNNRIQKFQLDGTFLASWGSPGTGNSQFNWPYGIACDGTFVYVADTLNNRVQKFLLDGTYVTQWGKYSTAAGQFNTPADIATGGGNVLVADMNNLRIQRFFPDGTFSKYWGCCVVGQPEGVMISGDYVYVSDIYYNKVVEFTLDGIYVSTLGGPGSGNGQFNTPRGMVNVSGNIYVVDSANNRIQEFNSPCGPSVTPTPSRTPTGTLTQSETTSPTISSSPSPTETLSFSMTVNPSGTVSPTWTASASPTCTETLTQSPSPTVSVTLTASPSITETCTAGPSATKTVVASVDPPAVVSVVIAPNPLAQGGPGTIVVQFLGNAEQIEVEVYSPGYTLIDKSQFSGSVGPGFVPLNVNASHWPLGLIFLRVTARGHGGVSSGLAKGYVIR